jgi:hypothetical protein
MLSLTTLPPTRNSQLDDVAADAEQDISCRPRPGYDGHLNALLELQTLDYVDGGGPCRQVELDCSLLVDIKLVKGVLARAEDQGPGCRLVRP